MPLSKHDPYTVREAAQIIALGIRIEKRRAYGKPTAALERQADRIREKAQAREDARGRK
ncbi:hypothetical protein SAMN05216532_3999 [Streptomyces sp. 2231.1]|uniref:hypothetical protein n=1 Tax=Streptomyces sp. 2231.1 TaxID=1855347 RepID=UPI00089C380B|nr:hypothetical protein [Streptomyces sp. 2231.1]SED26572.1 hypothetical protein SAMN05216532_3999 [Streptomyces sp. 2231.1]